MAKYRQNLPQLSGSLFLTDGGIETTLIFLKGFELPHFAAFILLETEKGIDALKEYYQSYIQIALDQGVGFILESPTWRANKDWGKKIGYSDEALAEVNQKAIQLLTDIRKRFENEKTKMVISCCIGPRGDGYNADFRMSAEEAEKYHTAQIKTASRIEADIVSAFTMTYTEEAIGIVQAAKKMEMPAVISFTVETDGKLPSGDTLEDAIEKVDNATDNGPVYYMINCANPAHFMNILCKDRPWIQRIRGIRANASLKSHKELDNAAVLDDGNPIELGWQYKILSDMLPNLNILGGCCGTDSRHIKEICLRFNH